MNVRVWDAQADGARKAMNESSYYSEFLRGDTLGTVSVICAIICRLWNKDLDLLY